MLKHKHLVVLQALHGLYEANDPDEIWCNTFRSIHGQVGNNVIATTQEIRKIVRFLKRKGFVEYSTAFSFDDGMAVGSGHFISKAGIKYIEDYT